MIFINSTATYENNSVYYYGHDKEKELRVSSKTPAYNETEYATEKEIIADTLYSVFSKYIKN